MKQLILFLAASAAALPLTGQEAVTAERIHRHALAFGAILNTSNGDIVDHLVGQKRLPGEEEQEKHVLADSWDVRSRGDLLKLLDRLQQGGHRKAYYELQEKLRLIAPELLPLYLTKGGQAPVLDDSDRMVELPEPDAVEISRRFLVIRYLAAPAIVVDGQATLPVAAWDYGRYVNLCTWGYRAGYLSESEAWDRLIPMARLIQSRYHSWAEFAAEYVRGREFWSMEDMRGFGMFTRAAIVKLQRPGELWAQIPWDESLGAGPIMADLYVPPQTVTVAIPAAPAPASAVAPTTNDPDAAFANLGEKANWSAMGPAVRQLSTLDRAFWSRTDDHNEGVRMYFDLRLFKTRADLDRYRGLIAGEMQIVDAILKVRDTFWTNTIAGWRAQGIGDDEIKRRLARLRTSQELGGQVGSPLVDAVLHQRLCQNMIVVGDLVQAHWQEWSALSEDQAKQAPNRKARFNDPAVDAAYVAALKNLLVPYPDATILAAPPAL